MARSRGHGAAAVCVPGENFRYIGSNKEPWCSGFLQTVPKFSGARSENEELSLLCMVGGIRSQVYLRAMLQTDKGAWKGDTKVRP